jgi:crossover junction endodeoxyribonuclease RusA
VVIRVTHYCETVIGDVDNLTKPIQDALQGVVYRNDSQVSDTIGNRRRIDGSFVVRYMSMLLAAAFSDGRQFVHIRVFRSPRRQALG